MPPRHGASATRPLQLRCDGRDRLDHERGKERLARRRLHEARDARQKRGDDAEDADARDVAGQHVQARARAGERRSVRQWTSARSARRSGEGARSAAQGCRERSRSPRADSRSTSAARSMRVGRQSGVGDEPARGERGRARGDARREAGAQVPGRSGRSACASAQTRRRHRHPRRNAGARRGAITAWSARAKSEQPRVMAPGARPRELRSVVRVRPTSSVWMARTEPEIRESRRSEAPDLAATRPRIPRAGR